MRHPVDAGARQRLLEAQRAEAEALRKVETADKGCTSARDRLAAADAKLLEAQRTLVRTSGAARAALLLGVDETTLRRDLRRADQSSDGPSSQVDS
ncbi:hypothetical protein [Terrabacter carboxydivorans]|uniref:DNA binding HTH domain-containing protein n=1 Tax=Terrabacter carboxydivorans TaxID=619730 RepID=A0ABN3MKD9_9MICO